MPLPCIFGSIWISVSMVSEMYTPHHVLQTLLLVTMTISFAIHAGVRKEQVSVFQTASAFRKLSLKNSPSLQCLLPLLFCNCSSIQELAMCGEDMDPAVLSSLVK
jgi:hypothetical protein